MSSKTHTPPTHPTTARHSGTAAEQSSSASHSTGVVVAPVELPWVVPALVPSVLLEPVASAVVSPVEPAPVVRPPSVVPVAVPPGPLVPVVAVGSLSLLTPGSAGHAETSPASTTKVPMASRPELRSKDQACRMHLQCGRPPL